MAREISTHFLECRAVKLETLQTLLHTSTVFVRPMLGFVARWGGEISQGTGAFKYFYFFYWNGIRWARGKGLSLCKNVDSETRES